MREIKTEWTGTGCEGEGEDRKETPKLEQLGRWWYLSFNDTFLGAFPDHSYVGAPLPISLFPTAPSWFHLLHLMQSTTTPSGCMLGPHLFPHLVINV